MRGAAGLWALLIALTGTACAVGEAPSRPACSATPPAPGMQQARVSTTEGRVAGAWRDVSATVVQVCVTASRLPDDLPVLRDAEGPAAEIETVAVTAAGSGRTATSLRLIYPPTWSPRLVLSGPLAEGELAFTALRPPSCPSPARSRLVECPRTGWLQTLRWDTGILVEGASTKSLVAELASVPVRGATGSVPGALVVGTQVVDGRLVLDVGVIRDELESPGPVRLSLSAVYDFADSDRGIEGRLPVLSEPFEVEPRQRPDGQ